MGTIDFQPSLLIFERAAFPTSLEEVRTVNAALTNIKNLGANDIYAWYLASLSPPPSGTLPPDLKLNLIYPCTETHIKKYSPQSVRMVTETSATYAQHVRPYMKRKREEGRLNWVFNIIEGRTEQEDIIVRQSRELGKDEEGFLILPDMNWDRREVEGMRLLCLVERRDVWSLRDLKKKDVKWLKRVREGIVKAVVGVYGEKGVEEDMLRFYVHCGFSLAHSFLFRFMNGLHTDSLPDQPTYYHFHVHVTHVRLEANATQITGKAFGLENVISQLESMADTPNASMADVDLTYSLGEASELWTEVFGPLKAERKV